LSYRDLEELLAEGGIQVDHVSLFCWVQRFTPLVIEAGRPCRHAAGSRWLVDETHVKVAGRWRDLDRAVDQPGQVIDVHVSARRDVAAARRLFTAALACNPEPAEVVSDLAPALAQVIADLLAEVFHNTKGHANNRVECDHGRLKARLRPMRGVKTDGTAGVAVRGHAFIHNLRRHHYQLGTYAAAAQLTVAAAFDQLARAM
jgi:transposase-like protein